MNQPAVENAQPSLPPQTKSTIDSPGVKSKKTILIFILLGFFIILQIIIGIIGVAKSIKKPVVTPQPPIVPRVTPIPTQTTDETANWKTYTNSESKISFRYPPVWITKEYEGYRVVAGDDRSNNFSVEISIDSPIENETDPEKIIAGYLDYNVGSTSQFLTSGIIINKEDVEVNGYKATKYILQESDPKSAGGNYTKAWVFVPNNNRVTFIWGEPYEGSGVKIINLILSTFRFDGSASLH